MGVRQAGQGAEENIERKEDRRLPVDPLGEALAEDAAAAAAAAAASVALGAASACASSSRIRAWLAVSCSALA